MTKTTTDTAKDQRAGLDERALKCLDYRLTGSQAVIALSVMKEFVHQELAEAAMYIDIRDKQMNEDGYTIHRLRAEAVDLRSQLNAANERRTHSESVLQIYADEENWHGKEQENMWDVYWTGSNADGYDKAREYFAEYPAQPK